MTPMKKFKVVSDGTIANTKIYAPDGSILGNVQKLVLTLDTNEDFVQAVATIFIPEVDVEIPEEVFCKKEKVQ